MAKLKPRSKREYGLAAYKMLEERAAREVEFILGVGGITLKNNTRLGRDVSLAELRRDFDAVFLGAGHNEVNRLGLEGEDALGAHSAVDFIARIRQEDLTSLPVGRRVVVIGGGNTAIGIAVQIRRLGAEHVTLVYRRGASDMGATNHEQQLAQTSGVHIMTWARPSRVETDADGVTAVTFEYTRPGPDGRLAGSGEHFTIEADQVFKAMGQKFSDTALHPDEPAADDLPAIENGRFCVDAERRTSLPGVWAGGDCVPGRDLTVVATIGGR